MKNQFIAGTVALATVVFGVALPTNPVQAAGLTCSITVDGSPVDLTGRVTPNSGCQRGLVNNDVLNPLQVNEDALFDFADWQFAGKDEPGLTSSNGFIDISLEFSALSVVQGTWNIASLLPSGWTNALLVFKGGGGNIVPNEYVGYLLNPGQTSGSWLTPFANNNNGNAGEVSHISLYYRTGSETVIPTPALLPGLIGMGLAALRKRQQAEPVIEE